MSETEIQNQLDEINRKLDLISSELVEVARQRAELDDLKKDLTLVARDVFNSSVTELEDVAPFVNTGDFLHLIKKILRNINTITSLFEQLENALDFYRDAKPIGKSLFNDLLELLDQLDRQGYFVFAKEMTTILRNIISNFSAEDIRLLADNIVSILETAKSLTQPEMLQTVNNAVTVFQSLDTENIDEYSPWRVLREINSPEMRRGLGFAMTFLKNISNVQDELPNNS